MVWPPRVKVRPTAAQRRKRAALKARSVACASSGVMPNDVISGEVGATRVEAVSGAVSVRITSVPSYACHYCRRTGGRQTRDHKMPKAFGGSKSAANIVRCCLMCNTIKDSRPYALFVLLFADFLAQHGEEYRAANPDDGRSISTMHKKFRTWLHVLQHAEGVEDNDDLVCLVADATAGAS